MQSRVTLELPARLESRHVVENKLRALCQMRGHPSALGDTLISAFIEAFNNVVLHAYRDRVDGVVSVVLQMDDSAAVIELSDSGQSFDLMAIPPPPELAEGGYGLHIIRSLMSEVSYFQEGGRNVLRMTRRFPKNALPATPNS